MVSLSVSRYSVSARYGDTGANVTDSLHKTNLTSEIARHRRDVLVFRKEDFMFGKKK